MCMSTTNKVPMVAKRDISVVKYLRPEGTGYKTPCRDVSVELDETLVANPKEPDFSFSYNTFDLNGGAIHATTKNVTGFGEAISFRGIIKEGTKYWISLHGNCIAAEKLLITSLVTDQEKMHVSLIEDLLDNAPKKGSFFIGQVLTNKGKFVSPLNCKDTPVGMVVGFNNEDEPLIWNMEIISDRFSTVDGVVDEISEDPVNDWKGHKHFLKFLKDHKGDIDKYPLYQKCLSYKPQVGTWYIPAYAEQFEMFKNTAIINAALQVLGKPNVETGWYYTSSEYSSHSMWRCCLYSHTLDRRWYYRDYCYSTCFFLALPKAPEGIKKPSILKRPTAYAKSKSKTERVPA